MLISDAFRRGSLLVATVLAGGLWWVVGCTPISIDPGSDAAPSIVGRNGAVAYPFGGFVYPPSGPVEYPGHWGTAGVMELDVPLRSLARGDEGLELGPPYYAFTVNVRVEGLRTLLLQWGTGNNTWDMAKVAGPCDPQTGAAAREFMHQTALREAGVASVAAYDMVINEKLAGGEPVWWVTCEPDAPGEILSTTPARVDYNVAVLVPQAKLGEGGIGRLLIYSRPLGEGPISDVLRITLRETPRIFAVAGDSMAWGQGLFYQEKWWWRVYDKARSNNGASERLYVRAHSASHLNGGRGSIAETADRGCTPSATHQELPFGADSVQCQLVQIARPTCLMDAATLDQPGVVPSFSCEQTPNAAPEAVIGPAAEEMDDPRTIALRHGPRVDFLFLDGCINDVGSVRIHTDLNGSLNQLANDIDVECDVLNSVPDLREEFSNASITWLGYHRTWSEQTAVLNPARCPASLTVGAISNSGVYPFNVIVAANSQEAVDDIGERAGLFQERSNQMLEESIATLTGDMPGRGGIRFLPLAFFDAGAAAYAPDSLNWELNCIDPALQTQDSVLEQRYDDCATAIDVLTLEEIVAGIDWFATDWTAEGGLHGALMFCQRAPFLHPDRDANGMMGDLVIDALTPGL